MRRPSNLDFPLDQTFFGFSSKDRKYLHDALFDLVWWGAGRWSIDDVYNMPLPMRRLWVSKLNEKLTPTDNKPTSVPQKSITKGPF
jgi:hypothetical protein